MADSNSTTVIQNGQLAVATVAQTGDLLTGTSTIDTTAVVQTEAGPQLCVKTVDLNGGGGGGGYVLPAATSDTLGGIKVGENLTIEEDGTLNAQAGGGDSVTRTYTNKSGKTIDSDVDFSSYADVIVKKNGVTLQRSEVVHVWQNDVNPALTANGTLGGDSYAAAASSQYSTSGAGAAFRAFNPAALYVADDGWYSGPNVSGPWWITFYTPTPVLCSKVIYYGEISTPGNPHYGKLQGSNDNSTWTDLANITFPSNNIDVVVEVEVNATQSYKYFRSYFTEAWESTYCSLQQVQVVSNPVVPNDYLINGNQIVFTDALISTDSVTVEASGMFTANRDLSNLNDAGKINAAHLAMPSSVYDELTTPTSQTTRYYYRAPADGYFALKFDRTSALFITLANASKPGLGVYMQQADSNTVGDILIYTLAEKGDIVYLWFGSSTPQYQSFRFYYANGATSEHQGA